MDVPDMKGRVEILKVHSKNKKLDDGVDLEEIAARTPGFSGADLANLLNEVDIMPKSFLAQLPYDSHTLYSTCSTCFVVPSSDMGQSKGLFYTTGFSRSMQ